MADLFMHYRPDANYQTITFESPGIDNLLDNRADTRTFDFSLLGDPVPKALVFLDGLIVVGKPLVVDLANYPDWSSLQLIGESPKLITGANPHQDPVTIQHFLYAIAANTLASSPLYSYADLDTNIVIGDFPV